MTAPRQQPIAASVANVAIALNAVLAAIEDETPKVLSVRSPSGDLGLPYGPFDPERHRTFEIGMREWVERQTKVQLGYIEQLYTFGDKGREAPAAALDGGAHDERVVSVGYLALAPAPGDMRAQDASWRSWYQYFPWEDWRQGEPEILRARILGELESWVERADDQAHVSARRARVNLAFGLDGLGWEEERTIDRYELIYEAGLVFEAWRDRATAGLAPPRGRKPAGREMGDTMISDHRRILATAIGRLRGKLKYRPILFEMTRPKFTLLDLQHTVEAIVGFEFHKQNFRRSVEKSGFVEPTGETTQQTSGRPAALFQVDRTGVRARAASGLAIPRMRGLHRI
ncbi:MAG: NAD regulator [Pseudomonadota bacterium]